MNSPTRIVLLAVALIAAFSSDRLALAAAEGDVAPAWSLASPDGDPIRYPDAAGDKPSVVLFWATWCPYCRALMPYLDDIRGEYAQQGVRVFAVNIKEDADPAQFARESGFDFVYALDGDPVAAEYSVRFTPGLFVVNADGTIAFRRRSTELPPGREVAEYWAGRVRAALDSSLAASRQ